MKWILIIFVVNMNNYEEPTLFAHKTTNTEQECIVEAKERTTGFENISGSFKVSAYCVKDSDMLKPIKK